MDIDINQEFIQSYFNNLNDIDWYNEVSSNIINILFLLFRY